MADLGRPDRAPLASAAVALLACAAALGVSLFVAPLLTPSPFPELFLAAVALSAWYGGLGPGLIATLVSACASLYFFATPRSAQPVPGLTVGVELAMFLVAAVVISSLRGTLRSAGRQVKASMLEAQTQQLRLAFLAEASSVLGTSLDYEATLATVAHLAVPFVADFCAVDVCDETGAIRRVALSHVSRRKARLARELSRRHPLDPAGTHPTVRVLRTGRAEVVPDVSNAPPASLAGDDEHLALLRALEVRSAMVVPLVARGRTLGAISLLADESGRRYGEGDLALAEDLARRCAAAIDNARLYREAEDEIAQRRRAEHRLRESEERLALAVEAAGMGVWDWDLESGEITVTWAESFEVAPGGPTTFRGTYDEFLARVLPADRATVQLAIQRAIREGDYDTEFRVVAPDGTTRWIAAKGRVHRDEHDRAVRLIGVPVDVTERKGAEQRLALQYATTRVLAEAPSLAAAAPRILQAICECLGWERGALWTVDGDAQLLRCIETWHTPARAAGDFEAASRHTAFAPGIGLPGRVWTSGEPAWIRDVVTDTNFPRAPIAGREGLHGAFGFPIRSGSEVLGVLEFFSHEIRPPDEALLQMVGTVGTQIGQFLKRTRAEAELGQLLVREQAARAVAEFAQWRASFLAEASTVLAASLDYQATLESLARLVVPYLADWCTVDVFADGGSLERKAVAHADPQKAELLRGLLGRYPPPHDDRFLATILRGKSRLVSEVSDDLVVATAQDAEHLRLLRELRVGSYILVPLVARGRPLGALGLSATERGRYGADDLALAEDLARRAALTIDNALLFQELQGAARRKDEFLAMLGHELRNPLGAIRTSLAVLNRVSSQAPAAVRQRAIIERQAGNLGRLVDDLLDVSRVMSGKVALQRAPVDLNDTVSECLQALRAAVAERRHEVAFTPAPEPVTVEGDAVRLEQVVSNLLDNAVKYTPPGGRILVSVAPEGSDGVVRVRDTGIGIDPETLPRVFELFTQAERSLDRAQGGLGLGLPLVRRLVEQHGGSVRVESAGRDRGTEFIVRLPLLPGARATPPAPSPQPVVASARDILVIEDNADGRDALRALLELAGHRVAVAEDGPRALEMARHAHPEVALVDIGLPGLDGYQVAERLRALSGPRIYLVALTGYGQPEDRRRTREAGFDAHLVKPVDPDELTRALAGSASSDAA